MALRYRCVLFDFDGTIADTGEGIRRSIAYCLEKLGRPALDRAALDSFIGPPLHDSFMAKCGMTEAEAEHAVAVYRERYVDVGLYESTLYPGIGMLLRALRRAGAYVAIASAKPQFMIERLSAHFGIDKYLDAIVGIGLDRHSADKRDLILRALPEGMPVEAACMVGDRRFDIEAAKALGLTAMGADYGYSLPGELEAAGADVVCPEVRDLSAALLGSAPEGLFISLEGSDGCGKTTQINLLREHLERRGFEVVVTREPGGCPISERIREVILSLDSKGMSSECEALLYAASRAEHVRETILPALKSGKIVICDRFLDSSIAYQAYGRELGEAFVRQINEPAVRLAFPQLTLLLEVNRAESKRRMANGAPLDRLEIERDDFFARVQSGYDALVAKDSGRVRRVDASKGIDEVFEQVRRAVDALLDGPDKG